MDIKLKTEDLKLVIADYFLTIKMLFAFRGIFRLKQLNMLVIHFHTD